MKLTQLVVKNYRSLRNAEIDLSDLDLFIGANGSGKSTILDTLRFLHEGVRARDFRVPVYSRGGIVHLAWKGSEADQIELLAQMEDENRTLEWSVKLIRNGYEFQVEEEIQESRSNLPPSQLLVSVGGKGWWWSGEKGERVVLQQTPTACAVTAASADASFPARGVSEFVGRWGFFDPNPFLLRRDWVGLDSDRLDHYGRNLAETLHALSNSSPEVLKKIVGATRAVVGLPSDIETRESEDRVYFVQDEPGLRFPVHQMGVSSGTLRILALMTALLGEPEPSLIGIEEPENYVHPAALSSFTEHMLDARGRVQLMITTHSPLLLDFLDEPTAVAIVERDDRDGTSVTKENAPAAVRRALDDSGFGLGEYHQTRGFGGA